MSSSRRRFLQFTASGCALTGGLGIGARLPACFAQTVEQIAEGDRILVVVQLSGGNDGLNSVIPVRDDSYYKRRPNLAIPRAQCHSIDDQTGLHPSLRGLADLLQSRQLCIVQGVGYPKPNRSHFESMDIWHTCQTSKEPRTTGWLGKLFESPDIRSVGKDAVGLHLGGEQQPLALQSRTVRIPSIRSIEEFKLQADGNPQFRTLVSELASADRAAVSDLLGFVQTSTSTALVASERVAAAQSDYKAAREYPDTGLAQKLRIVAQLINAGLRTRVYYVTLDGFDTHAQQAESHAALSREWGDALQAFVQDLSSHGHGKRVLTMCFSEFGRRVEENASKGTDHGAAAPVFLAGDAVQSGVIGLQPDLTDLDDGDLKFHTDFRQVYATILEQWLGTNSQSIIGADYPTLPLIAAKFVR